MDMSIPTQTLADGSQYRVTPQVMTILSILMSMSLEDYTQARLFLSPWQFFYSFMRRNDLALESFEALVQRDYWRWQTQMLGTNIGKSAADVPIPPKKAQN